MGRPAQFDLDEVLTASAELFGRIGYHAASVDDIVGATGVHRGSLYRTFGSKRGLFLSALQAHVSEAVPRLASELGRRNAAGRPRQYRSSKTLDLLMVAAWEVSRDEDVRSLVQSGLEDLGQAVVGDDSPVATRRAAGLALLASRLAEKCFPGADAATVAAPLLGAVVNRES